MPVAPCSCCAQVAVLLGQLQCPEWMWEQVAGNGLRVQVAVLLAG